MKDNFELMLCWLARGLPLPLEAITNNRRIFIGLDNFVDFDAMYWSPYSSQSDISGKR